MSDTWNEIQSLKTKRGSMREKLLKRRKERAGLVADITGEACASPGPGTDTNVSSTAQPTTGSSSPAEASSVGTGDKAVHLGQDFEQKLLSCLMELGLDLPFDVNVLVKSVSKLLNIDVPLADVEELLEKFAAQTFIVIEKQDQTPGKNSSTLVTSVDHAKLAAVSDSDNQDSAKVKENASDEPVTKSAKHGDDSLESLLSMQSAKEKESKKMNEEILELLTKPTAKEQSLVEKFKSQGGAQVREFCPFGTREECGKLKDSADACKKLHFKKIIHKHTDEALGDCSFLNTCFHMDTCKYVHYEIDASDQAEKTDVSSAAMTPGVTDGGDKVTLIPPQWICCDVRLLDMTILGKFSIIMADPPWDIHMELPYGTMSDDEMRTLNIPSVQDEGYIFLWVTGRAMELGRECLKLWGYERCDELIWVKTNQLQRIIRTGRTGHWINHGKEHCLIGVKGNPKHMNRGLDCDVLVAEVRATSHKPDEIYGMIERLSPGSRKLELFGRPHNVQPNWITLGNQVDGVRLLEPDVVRKFKKCYPDGNCLKPKS